MAPRIPISADPSQAVSAFERITAAMRKAGQEGRALSELDLSHPELKDFADDIKRLQANFEALRSLGRAGVGGVAREVARGRYRDVFDWYRRHGEQFRGDEAEQARHFRTVGGYVTYGTRWSPPPPDEKKETTGFPIPGMSVLKPLLTLAGLGGILSMAGEAVREGQDEAVQADTLKRILADTSTDFATFRDLLRDASEGLQLTHTETLRLAQSFAKASGLSDNITRIAHEAMDAAGFSRAFGLDPGQTSQLFGQARWLKTGDGLTAKELGVVFADAIAAGGMWSKADEVLSAIVNWVQTSERVIVDSPNIHAYASMQAAMNASGRPGLQGQAGAALIGQMDQAIRQGGGAGEAGRNFLWRALAEGGQLDPFRMEYLLEGGLFGSRKRAFGAGSATTNAELIFAALRKQYANPFVRASAASNLLNISMRQAMAMDEVSDDPRKFGLLQKMLDKYSIKPEQLNASGIQAMAKLAVAKTPAALQQVKADILAREDVTAQDKDRLAGTFYTDEGLREAMARLLAGLSRETTAGVETQGAMVNFKRALTESGANLIEVTNVMKAGVTKAVDALNTTIDALTGTHEAAVNGIRGRNARNLAFERLPAIEDEEDMVDAAGGTLTRRGRRSITLNIAPVEFTLRDQSGKVVDRQTPEASFSADPQAWGGRRR